MIVAFRTATAASVEEVCWSTWAR